MTAQRQTQGFRPLVQTLLQIIQHLSPHRLFKAGGIGGLPIKIVQAYLKWHPGGPAQNPLQGLRLHLHPLELPLLPGIAAIRLIPVAKVRQLAPGLPGNQPVGDLVQRTAEEAVGEMQLVLGPARTGWQIHGLITTANQAGVVGGQKTLVEYRNKMIRVMLAGHGSA